MSVGRDGGVTSKQASGWSKPSPLSSYTLGTQCKSTRVLMRQGGRRSFGLGWGEQGEGA
jgi:hypothetical protein